jgi:hypothetical protein
MSAKAGIQGEAPKAALDFGSFPGWALGLQPTGLVPWTGRAVPGIAPAGMTDGTVSDRYGFCANTSFATSAAVIAAGQPA